MELILGLHGAVGVVAKDQRRVGTGRGRFETAGNDRCPVAGRLLRAEPIEEIHKQVPLVALGVVLQEGIDRRGEGRIEGSLQMELTA